jgi:hypothetical protein
MHATCNPRGSFKPYKRTYQNRTPKVGATIESIKGNITGIMRPKISVMFTCCLNDISEE